MPRLDEKPAFTGVKTGNRRLDGNDVLSLKIFPASMELFSMFNNPSEIFEPEHLSK